MQIKSIDHNFYRYPDALQIDHDGIISDPAVQVAITVVMTPQKRISRLLTGYRIEHWMHAHAQDQVDRFANAKDMSVGCRECPLHRYAAYHHVSRICGGLANARNGENRGPIWHRCANGVGLTRIFSFHGQALGNTELLEKPVHKETQKALLSQALCLKLPESPCFSDPLTSGNGSPTMPTYDQSLKNK